MKTGKSLKDKSRKSFLTQSNKGKEKQPKKKSLKKDSTGYKMKFKVVPIASDEKLAVKLNHIVQLKQ